MSATMHAALAMAAISSATASADEGAPVRAPIAMAMAAHGSGIRLTVTGNSASAFEASYALEVSSTAGRGTNHSVERGTARLVPGRTVTLVTLDLANARAGTWTATLQVDPVGAGSYRQSLSSDPTPSNGAAD